MINENLRKFGANELIARNIH